MTSFAISPYTMPAALASSSILDWESTSIAHPSAPPHQAMPLADGYAQESEQQRWLERYPKRLSELTRLGTEIAAHATEDAADHMAWLAERGWPAAITRGSRGDLFLAAVLGVVAEWKRAGSAYTAKDGRRRADLEGVLIGERVALIPTVDESITVLVAPVGRPDPLLWPTTIEGLLGAVLAAVARADAKRLEPMPGTLDLPMVHLRTSSPATYMLGLRSGAGHVVSQAHEAFELQLSHRGVVARAKAELAVSRGISSKPRLYIDTPFIAAVLKGGLAEPLFAAYCDKDCWAEPPSGAI